MVTFALLISVSAEVTGLSDGAATGGLMNRELTDLEANVDSVISYAISLCGLVVRVPGYGFDSRGYQIS
jgi:hypothetical protein